MEKARKKNESVSPRARAVFFSRKKQRKQNSKKIKIFFTLTSCPLAASSAATACITNRWLLPETSGTARTLSLGRAPRCQAGAEAKRGTRGGGGEVVVVLVVVVAAAAAARQEEEEPRLLFVVVVVVVGRGCCCCCCKLFAPFRGSGVGVGPAVGVGVGCLEAAMERRKAEAAEAAAKARAKKRRRKPRRAIFFQQKK